MNELKELCLGRPLNSGQALTEKYIFCAGKAEHIQRGQKVLKLQEFSSPKRWPNHRYHCGSVSIGKAVSILKKFYPKAISIFNKQYFVAFRAKFLHAYLCRSVKSLFSSDSFFLEKSSSGRRLHTYRTLRLRRLFAFLKRLVGCSTMPPPSMLNDSMRRHCRLAVSPTSGRFLYGFLTNFKLALHERWVREIKYSFSVYVSSSLSMKIMCNIDDRPNAILQAPSANVYFHSMNRAAASNACSGGSDGGRVFPRNEHGYRSLGGTGTSGAYGGADSSIGHGGESVTRTTKMLRERITVEHF